MGAKLGAPFCCISATLVYVGAGGSPLQLKTSVYPVSSVSCSGVSGPSTVVTMPWIQ